MGKAGEEIKKFDDSSLLRMKREIAEIESKLKVAGSDLDERGIQFLNSRLSFLKNRLEDLENSGARI